MDAVPAVLAKVALGHLTVPVHPVPEPGRGAVHRQSIRPAAAQHGPERAGPDLRKATGTQ
ncbi:MAG: hypothetical protein KAJ03_07785 [Gammaproteobacteria bacterium]|nr:hypothetical protein [Gammaproteobacteria bacterium]